MNKQHWISIRLESDIPDSKIRELLDKGYYFVLNKGPKAKGRHYSLGVFLSDMAAILRLLRPEISRDK